MVTPVTTRLPSTGPMAQVPMAVARPSCGEKSRISAGVTTSTTPSTKLSTANSTRYHVLPGASGNPATSSSPLNSEPKTTRFPRPQRSASPAKIEANAPTTAPAITTQVKYVKLVRKCAMIEVATPNWM